MGLLGLFPVPGHENCQGVCRAETLANKMYCKAANAEGKCKVNA